MTKALATILYLKCVLGSCISFHCNMSKQLKCVNVNENYSYSIIKTSVCMVVLFKMLVIMTKTFINAYYNRNILTIKMV